MRDTCAALTGPIAWIGVAAATELKVVFASALKPTAQVAALRAYDVNVERLRAAMAFLLEFNTLYKECGAWSVFPVIGGGFVQ